MPVEVLISIVKDWYEWLVSGLVHLLSNDPFRRSGLMPCTQISLHNFCENINNSFWKKIVMGHVSDDAR